MILATHGIVSSYIGIDSDAQAFITATGITNTIQKNAIINLVSAYKTYGIWTKRKAIYPIVGGTATTHKFNLKDPRDLNAAFRLDFFGGMAHDSNGLITNFNSYANTYLTPSSVLDINSSSFTIYSRTNGNEASVDLGANSGGSAMVDIYLRFTNGNMLSRIYNTSSYQSQANANTIGCFTFNRINSTTTKQLRNGSVINTSTNSSVAMPSIPLFIGALNNQGTSFASTTRGIAFVSIGEGLTDTEAANEYSAIQAFQTALGR
jgi:hypothetical protein